MKTVRELVADMSSNIYNLPIIIQKFLFNKAIPLSNKTATAIDDYFKMKPGTARLYNIEYNKYISNLSIITSIYKEDEII